jgi:uncharacterized RDD family membrane protein YckC
VLNRHSGKAAVFILLSLLLSNTSSKTQRIGQLFADLFLVTSI